jgi:hypothetical protein
VTVGVRVLGLDRGDERAQRLWVAAGDVVHVLVQPHACEGLVEKAHPPVLGHDREDRAAETGEQQRVVHPPGELPQHAEPQRHDRLDREPAGEHEGELYGVPAQLPAAVVAPTRHQQGHT